MKRKFRIELKDLSDLGGKVAECKVCGKPCEGLPQNNGIVTVSCGSLWAYVEGYPVHLSHRIKVRI